jgi:hypothetical protein
MKSINFNKSKKGESTFLPEEVVKMVIAVLVILFLFGLLYGLYSIMQKSSKLDQAKQTLENINGKLKTLTENSNEITYLLVSPTDWFIIGFDNTNKIPSCLKKDCLCICPKQSEISCENGGVCSPVDGFIEVKDEVPSNNYATYLDLANSNSILINSGKNIYFRLVNGKKYISVFKQSVELVTIQKMADSLFDSDAKLNIGESYNEMSVKEILLFSSSATAENWEAPIEKLSEYSKSFLIQYEKDNNLKIEDWAIRGCYPEKGIHTASNCWLYLSKGTGALNDAPWVRLRDDSRAQQFDREISSDKGAIVIQFRAVFSNE